MKEFDAKVRLNEENGGKTGELDIMSPPPFDKGYFNGVTYGIKFKDPVFEAEKKSGWIPVEERLPEKSGVYAICVKRYGKLAIELSSHIEGELWCADNAIAWMKLPEPYEMGE